MKELATTGLWIINVLIANQLQPYDPVGATIAAFIGFTIWAIVIIPYLINYNKK